MSGVIPASASRAGVVSSSSQGDTGNVRKSQGFMNTSEAECQLDTLMRKKQHLEVPDNTDAIACAVALSLADIGTATVGKKGATNEHNQNPTSLHSNAHDDGVVSHDLPLAQNAAPKERQGPSHSPGCDDRLTFFRHVERVVLANRVDDHPPSHGGQEI